MAFPSYQLELFFLHFIQHQLFYWYKFLNKFIHVETFLQIFSRQTMFVFLIHEFYPCSTVLNKQYYYHVFPFYYRTVTFLHLISYYSSTLLYNTIHLRISTVQIHSFHLQETLPYTYRINQHDFDRSTPIDHFHVVYLLSKNLYTVIHCPRIGFRSLLLENLSFDRDKYLHLFVVVLSIIVKYLKLIDQF